MTERFELLEKLGSGGMGVVWKARDTATGEIVALKLLHEQFADDPQFVARFEREVDVTSRIDSPYVVKMIGYGLQGNRPYACMEFVDGESLRDLLRRDGPFTWDEAKYLLRQVAAGLQAAHEAGVVHRDVKPSNILLAAGGVAKLVDFGIAKAADLTALTGAATTMGTAGYTAPEGESSPGADLYGLGCTAYEILSGAPPFVGDSPSQVLIKHIRDAPDLSRLPVAAQEVVGWLLQKDPRQRPASARAVLHRIAPPLVTRRKREVVGPRVSRRDFLRGRRYVSPDQVAQGVYLQRSASLPSSWSLRVELLKAFAIVSGAALIAAGIIWSR